MLCKAEPRIAKVCGYQAKIVEMSGKQLSKFFSKTFTDGRCHRVCCPVCSNTDVKGATMCQAKSVVYTAVCALCDKTHREDPSQKHRGKYIGQTSRTLAERAKEHRDALRNFNMKSFMLKHWTVDHKELDKAPEFKFSVVKVHKDSLSRLVHEAVLIPELGSLNSKSEYVGYRLARLSVERSEWELKKDAADLDAKEHQIKI